MANADNPLAKRKRVSSKFKVGWGGPVKVTGARNPRITLEAAKNDTRELNFISSIKASTHRKSFAVNTRIVSAHHMNMQRSRSHPGCAASHIKG